MKIEYEIQELNRRIDETYDEYVKNLTELRNKKNALAQHCNSTITVLQAVFVKPSITIMIFHLQPLTQLLKTWMRIKSSFLLKIVQPIAWI